MSGQTAERLEEGGSKGGKGGKGSSGWMANAGLRANADMDSGSDEKTNAGRELEGAAAELTVPISHACGRVVSTGAARTLRAHRTEAARYLPHAGGIAREPRRGRGAHEGHAARHTTSA